jgi:metal-sulfur cluster biosynthetic enzyme
LEKSQVMEVLRKINDPEHPVSILDLEIVTEDDVEITPDKVIVEFTPTVPFCPMGGAIGVIIKYALEKELGLKADVRVKAGKHIQEESLNQTLGDPERYEEAKRRFLEAGLMEHCIQAS